MAWLQGKNGEKKRVLTEDDLSEIFGSGAVFCEVLAYGNGTADFRALDVYQQPIEDQVFLDVPIVVYEIPGQLVRNGTYAEIKALRDAGELIPGSVYEITDYETIYVQPVSLEVRSDSTNLFNVRLLAIGPDRFAPEAWAAPTDRTQPEGSTITASTPLDRWRLLYDIDNDSSKYEWATETGKGVIYGLIDHRDNDLAYDFYNTKFRRYLITATTIGATAFVGKKICPTKVRAHFTIDLNTYDDLLTFDLTKDIRENIFKPHVSASLRSLNNNTFANDVYNNIFNFNCFNYALLSVSNYNKIGNNCNNALIIGDFTHNVISGNWYYNVFNNHCYGNNFNDVCHSNVFLGSCAVNIFGSYFYNNIIRGYCNGNTFGEECYNNAFAAAALQNCEFSSLIKNKDFSTFSSLYNQVQTQKIILNSSGVAVSLWRNASNIEQVTVLV